MSESFFKHVSIMIKHHRKQAQLTRLALANLAGVGKTVIYDIENGKRTIKLDTLMKILNILNIKVTLKSPLIERKDTERENQKS
ncbi:MAG: helix-turn-helix transcriptional regulator [Candidatus Margulisbacteria bacterium]|nr:helix-turn-helix transcriptional regulator [Candidatus Margulisiibacteriota bacterium]